MQECYGSVSTEEFQECRETLRTRKRERERSDQARPGQWWPQLHWQIYYQSSPGADFRRVTPSLTLPISRWPLPTCLWRRRGEGKLVTLLFRIISALKLKTFFYIFDTVEDIIFVLRYLNQSWSPLTVITAQSNEKLFAVQTKGTWWALNLFFAVQAHEDIQMGFMFAYIVTDFV